MVTNEKVSDRPSMTENLVGGLVGGVAGGLMMGLINYYVGAPFVFLQMCGYFVLPQAVIVAIEAPRNRVSKADAAVKFAALSVSGVAAIALTQLL